MSFEDAVMAWLRDKHPELWVGWDTVEFLAIEHSESRRSEMTYWPAETWVEIKKMKHGKTGQKIARKEKVWTNGSDPLEFARELFNYV